MDIKQDIIVDLDNNASTTMISEKNKKHSITNYSSLVYDNIGEMCTSAVLQQTLQSLFYLFFILENTNLTVFFPYRIICYNEYFIIDYC